ncbi:MAG: phage tail assembly protein [Pseudomonadota bacterium]
MNQDANIKTIELEEELTIGDQKIASLQIRRPRAGELRGLSLGALGQMNTDELLKLLPRITIPTIPAPILAELSSADLIEIAEMVTDFLLTKRKKATLPTM